MEELHVKNKQGVKVSGKEYAGVLESEVQQQWVEQIDNYAEDFVGRLEEMEKVIEKQELEPDRILAMLQQTMDDFVIDAERIEGEIRDISFIKHLRTRFHQRTHHILSKGYLFNRARVWPQGYQGDHKTLETIYRNIPLSDGLGYYFDLISLRTPLAVAVRNRIKRLQKVLKVELEQQVNPRVLNIACGSCRELVEIVPEIINSRAHFICVDNDEDALSFAQNRLSYADALSQIEFRKYNAMRLFDLDIARRDFGAQDIIYSVGFFDYLPSDFLVKLFNTLYTLLRPGGKLIAAFKDARRYRSQEYHWFVDWDGFLQRREEDFMKIFADALIPQSSISEMREESGVIVFYTLTKK